jgi:H+/Cl- antiporter ClcA
MALMQRSHVVILLFLAVAVMQGTQLASALRTGRASGRYGTITRQGQPRRFWRYIYSAYVVLLLCAVATLWALISPNSF